MRLKLPVLLAARLGQVGGVVVGAHDLSWMLALAVLMTLQKHAAWGPRIAWPAAVLLAAAGVAIGSGWWVVPLRSLRALCGA